MNTWEPTAALRRATAVTAGALGLALLVGQPVMVVLVVPLLLCSVLGVVHRPDSAPRLSSASTRRRCTRDRAPSRGC